jgi:2-polyprenyl-6-methoxyphenol hydroxylase-like FAD-dependent oxidoreductase
MQYGKELQSISLDGAHITGSFADGSSAQGTIIVGCDGAKSIVREILLGEDVAKLEDLDINMINISCAYSADTAKLLRSKHPCFKNSYHPTQNTMFWQSIQDVKDPDRPETWLFQNILSWVGVPRPEDLPDQASRTAFFKSKAEEYAEPWRSGALEIPDNLTFGIDRTTMFTPSMSWSDVLGGNVTLAGDAAHAMPPHRGQGLNNALEDAACLVRELTTARDGKKSLKDAIQAYEEDMRARTLKEIPISVMQARMVHSWDDLMNAPMIKMGMNKLKEQDAQKAAASARASS